MVVKCGHPPRGCDIFEGHQQPAPAPPVEIQPRFLQASITRASCSISMPVSLPTADANPLLGPAGHRLVDGTADAQKQLLSLAVGSLG